MDQRTIDTYNTLAKEYDDETIDFWNLFPRTFVDKFIELSGKDILNIGSGPGRDGLLLREAHKEVICLDASEAMIALSKEKGLQSILSGFDSLPFDDTSFDGAWAYTSFLHVPKKEIDIPLAETARILKPGGIFALGLIEGNTEGYRERSGVSMPRWFSFYQKQEVVDICKKHGFELVYFETFTPRAKNYLNFIFKKI